MRSTTFLTLIGAAALAALAGCTVKGVDQPALAGPSTFAHSIVLFAERNTLTQNGVDFTDIRVTSLSPTGQSEAVSLRAQVYVDGVAQDYGTLSSKNLVTPTTIRYTAPAASTNAAGQQSQTVTIAFTPTISGDFRSEFARQVDIRLEPQGVILPQNPNLVANFTASPQSPKVLEVTAFDASTSTNNGTPCLQQCTYAWDFGDGTSSAGLTTTHQFRTAGSAVVTLRVTDSRGATASKTQSVVVQAPTPPTVQFRISPTPAPVGVSVFFNASESQAIPPRTITSYSWDFGDGSTGTGVTQAHTYTGAGIYTVVLEVKDDAGASNRSTQNLTVGGGGGVNPVAQLTGTPTAGKPNQRVVFDASGSTPSTGAVITQYKFDFGVGETPLITTNPQQSWTYTSAGTFVASVEVTDSNGRTATKTVAITITP
jgi:PKD repeat protein